MKTMMSLDLKKKRIRLSKSTLLQLGKPSYIHCLINPTNRSIAFSPCEEGVKDALRVSYNKDGDCEFYSTTLVNLLIPLSDKMSTVNTYRINGDCNNSSLAVFYIDNIVPYNNPAETKENLI